MSDISIKYNNEVIGEMNESGTATLKTSQKKCVSDIDIEYTKPASETVGNPLTVTNNTNHEFHLYDIPTAVIDENYGIIFNIPSGITNGAVLSFCDKGDYMVRIGFNAQSDIYDVVMNDTPISYDNKAASYIYESAKSPNPINGQTYNVVISDKE